MQKAIQSAAERAGIGKVSPHELRYTLVARVEARRASYADIGVMIGHSPAAVVQMTARIYGKPVGGPEGALERLRAVVS